MFEVLNSAYIVPLGAFVLAGVLGGFGVWKKVRDAEMAHERELKIKEMEHAQRMKELELEGQRLAAGPKTGE
ncbi:hypothetical protein [Geothrix sp. PMB-07]|uniref:hypothetical protein n=1 Tax=Geothrix sp. PMB-07 TaxID=3068640 RepID=UPI002740766B|nr:hypothetical protein [Geothrix sp. PMB-07]WLT32317.1 hypothetical protein Q9293_03080 [Geothrix sp. PMB-07]